MFRKVLIPLDGSSLAERTLNQMQRLLSPATTEVVLVSVVEPWRYSVVDREFPSPDLLTQIHLDAEHYLESQCVRLQQAGYQVSTRVHVGDPAQVILDVCQETGADLIAMSTHGRSGFVRWALGSVAERVIQGATTPLLLVREATPLPDHAVQRILVPLDGSLLAEQALPHAERLAKTFAASITLLQVTQRLDEGSQRILFESEAEAERVLAEWRAKSIGYLERVAQPLQASGLNVEVAACFGDPDKAICEYADGHGIDLIVMSTHGRSGLSRWLYGSVTNKVLRGTNRLLLLVRNVETEASTD
jgi:nucleotide-binding universal stress UspA family protein